MEKLTKADLMQFTGTEQWYAYNLFGRKAHMTDGVKYLAERAGCYWLLDIILTSQMRSKVKGQPFQAWNLKQLPDERWKVTCEDGNGGVLCTQIIPFSDFPMDSVDIWFIDDVLLLPSEY
jgi:hypothetical protein